MEENTALLFLANLINGRESQKEGYALAVRWLCLRSDLRDKYIAEAQSIVDAWWSEELAMKASRERGPAPVVADADPSANQVSFSRPSAL